MTVKHETIKCRRCGAEFSVAEADDKMSKGPGSPSARKCPRCGFMNHLDVSEEAVADERIETRMIDRV